jgi:prephenate dehydrogenase
MISRIAILGTGLLGTSVGLALREAGFEGGIFGWNRSPEPLEIALKMGAVSSLAPDPIEAARAAEVTVLAVPIFATIDFMEKLAPVLSSDQLLTDVGSTKRVISETGARLYNQRDRAAFLPGHPMAGKERGGAELADANLFRGAMWLFTPDAAVRTFLEEPAGLLANADAVNPVVNADSGDGLYQGTTSVVPKEEPNNIGALAPAGISKNGVALIHDWRALVAAMGARTLDLDPARHDELVAWVSHLPQFTATALSALLEEEVGNAPELKDVGGRALREMTRLGSSPFSMWRDIAHTNTEAVERALLALEQRLAHLRENLRTPELREQFEQANKFRKG